MTKIHKIYPSSSAFWWAGKAVTEYSSGCLRQILLARNGVREPFNPMYAEVGEINEDEFEKRIPEGVAYEREKVIKGPIEGYENVVYSGRIDFDIGGLPIELKSGTSKNTRLNVIRKGKLKLNQLAQLISYMVRKKTDKGFLYSDYYEKDKKDKWVRQEGVKFKIKLDSEGGIWYKPERTLFDKKGSSNKAFPTEPVKSDFTVHDQIKHTMAQAEMLSTQSIADRPIAPIENFNTPCDYCVFSDVCDMVDKKDITKTKDFLNEGRKIITSKGESNG